MGNRPRRKQTFRSIARHNPAQLDPSAPKQHQPGQKAKFSVRGVLRTLESVHSSSDTMERAVAYSRAIDLISESGARADDRRELEEALEAGAERGELTDDVWRKLRGMPRTFAAVLVFDPERQAASV